MLHRNVGLCSDKSFGYEHRKRECLTASIPDKPLYKPYRTYRQTSVGRNVSPSIVSSVSTICFSSSYVMACHPLSVINVINRLERDSSHLKGTLAIFFCRHKKALHHEYQRGALLPHKCSKANASNIYKIPLCSRINRNFKLIIHILLF